MSEIIDGGYSYESIRRNAHLYNIHLDTSFKPDADDINTAIEHYNDCKKNPTVGLLARKHFETDNYPAYKHRNFSIMQTHKNAKAAYDSFETTFKKELYPKTGNARKFLIDKEFVVLNYVKPRAKAFSKMLFKLIGR